MDNEARSSVVASLIRLAGSHDFRDRADAGRALASFADTPQAGPPLEHLLLDVDDTFVTVVTAEALLRRADDVGLALVAGAVATADAQHADWIQTAVQNTFSVYADQRDAALRRCAVLLENADPQPARGIAQLVGMLTAINPVLHPADDR